MDNADPFRPFAPDDDHDPVAQPSNDWTPILPVPMDAPKLNRTSIDRCASPGFALSHMWEYVSETGGLMMVVGRYDKSANGAAGEKDIRPFSYCYGPDGIRQWRAKAIPFNRPLYRLNELARRPDAPVLVVEGEKAADAAQLRFPEYVVTTSSGGSHAAAKSDWRPLRSRRVTLWPDADEAGKGYVNKVTELLQDIDAVVFLVAVPSAWPTGWDLADAPPPGVGDAAVAALLADAASVREEPLPLFPPLPPAEPYPVEYLGSVLAGAAGAVARKVQVPVALAAQSVLAAASLAAQAHADVRLPFGQTRPLSLFLVTVAASGDRKTTADTEALWPIKKHEKGLRETHDQALMAWKLAHGAWSAQRKKIEANNKLDYVQRKEKLRDLGSEPEKPLYPILTAPDPTFEGLVKAWVSAPASLGVFTAEGGMFVGGHGMADENKLRTAAALSELWDGKPVKRLRAGDGVTLLYGRRLSLHIMVQPEVARQFLTDGTLRDQGLLSRMLVAAPSSLAGRRLYRSVNPDDDAAIRAYGARILSLLERRWPLVEGKTNELEPRVLPLSSDAVEVWTSFFDHVETQSDPEGELAPVGDLAAKAAEHAARIAGVITLVEEPDAAEIGEGAMACGVALADWYVAEALRLARAGRTSPALLKAKELLTWLQTQGEDAEFRSILQRGPSGTRLKSDAEAALAILKAHGWIREVSDQPRKLRVLTASNG